MPQKIPGKLAASDERVAQLLRWAPWLSMVLVSLPLPIVFLVMFLASSTTETAAISLLLSFVSMGLGLVVGLVLLILLLFYRRRWHSRLRERLAADGITAAEVLWFAPELSSEERRIWAELKPANPLLADAYCETLAARLTATRIIGRARGEMLRIERQMNRTRNIRGADTSALLNDLTTDRKRAEELRKEATKRLSEAKARLQTIEAAANRRLSQTETDSMLRRLASSQDYFPLALEMANLEEEALRELPSARLTSEAAGKGRDSFEP
jgi:hypothetical protein